MVMLLIECDGHVQAGTGVHGLLVTIAVDACIILACGVAKIRRHVHYVVVGNGRRLDLVVGAEGVQVDVAERLHQQGAVEARGRRQGRQAVEAAERIAGGVWRRRRNHGQQVVFFVPDR